MAKTAAVTTNLSTLKPGQVCNATVTLTNADTNAVTVTSIQPYVTDVSGAASASNQGQLVFGPNMNNVCNGSSGTLSQGWPVNFFGPQTQGSNGLTASQVYTVGCLLTVQDNVTGAFTNVNATTASVTVNSLY